MLLNVPKHQKLLSIYGVFDQCYLFDNAALLMCNSMCEGKCLFYIE